MHRWIIFIKKFSDKYYEKVKFRKRVVTIV